MKNLLTRIVAFSKTKEPALVLGSAAAVVELAVEVARDHPGQSWHALLPLIVGALVRRYVTPV